jgi:Terminase small subunit
MMDSFAIIDEGELDCEPHEATETAVEAPKAIGAKHEKFITEYMKDRNATAAAARSGYSVRSAAMLMAMGPIKDEIRRRLAQVAAKAAEEAKVTLQSLMAKALRAYEVAEGNNNPAGMVAATKLMAELSGHVGGQPVVGVTVNNQQSTGPDIRGTAQAIWSILKEASMRQGGAVPLPTLEAK